MYNESGRGRCRVCAADLRAAAAADRSVESEAPVEEPPASITPAAPETAERPAPLADPHDRACPDCGFVRAHPLADCLQCAGASGQLGELWQSDIGMIGVRGAPLTRACLYCGSQTDLTVFHVESFGPPPDGAEGGRAGWGLVLLGIIRRAYSHQRIPLEIALCDRHPKLKRMAGGSPLTASLATHFLVQVIQVTDHHVLYAGVISEFRDLLPEWSGPFPPTS